MAERITYNESWNPIREAVLSKMRSLGIALPQSEEGEIHPNMVGLVLFKYQLKKIAQALEMGEGSTARQVDAKIAKMDVQAVGSGTAIRERVREETKIEFADFYNWFKNN